MRRWFLSGLVAVSALGLVATPAGADATSAPKVLSYDFSDNNAPASAANGSFNIIVDLLGGEHGFLRMVAVAPANAGVSNLTCSWQNASKGSAECAFNFTAPGLWTIKSTLADAPHGTVIGTAVTDLRVGN